METCQTTLKLMWEMAYTTGIKTRQTEGQDGKKID